MKMAIGCDEAAFTFKESIKKLLLDQGIEVIDFGTFDDNPVLYPDIAVKVSEAIITGQADRGALFCGTGIGMAIAANKVPGIRAAVCHDSYSTERARKSNDAQIICMGARVIGLELAKQLMQYWLTYDFAGGGSADKVEKIKYYEACYCKHP